jgi:1,4-dihydroxy-2-naphthoyl-CoA synthase
VARVVSQVLLVLLFCRVSINIQLVVGAKLLVRGWLVGSGRLLWLWCWLRVAGYNLLFRFGLSLSLSLGSGGGGAC